MPKPLRYFNCILGPALILLLYIQTVKDQNEINDILSMKIPNKETKTKKISKKEKKKIELDNKVHKFNNELKTF